MHRSSSLSGILPGRSTAVSCSTLGMQKADAEPVLSQWSGFSSNVTPETSTMTTLAEQTPTLIAPSPGSPCCCDRCICPHPILLFIT